jgi:hypothetical protein
MNEETLAALRRVRGTVDAWIAEYGELGFFPRIGNIPAMRVADLKLVVAEAEGPHHWGVAVAYSHPDDGGITSYYPAQTYMTEDAARAAAECTGMTVVWWDENGSARGEWLPL